MQYPSRHSFFQKKMLIYIRNKFHNDIAKSNLYRRPEVAFYFYKVIYYLLNIKPILSTKGKEKRSNIRVIFFTFFLIFYTLKIASKLVGFI